MASRRGCRQRRWHRDSFAAWALAAGLYAAPHEARATPTGPLELQNPIDVSSRCASCHRFANPPDRASEPSWSPFLWQGSMMANAGRDPVFWAAVAIAADDEPGGTELCVRCHAPKAFFEGRGSAVSQAELLPDDLDGITCDVCHRMVDDGVTPPGNAQLVIDDVAVGPFVPKRGPWTYADTTSLEHQVAPSGMLGGSRVCGVCHDVTTGRERVDAMGRPLGTPFNEQRTYSEWVNSDFADAQNGRTCLDCHMPAVADVAGCEAMAESGRHASGGRRHELTGANRFMVSVLRDLYGSKGSGDLFDDSFDRTLERMDAVLATAATLEVSVPDQVDLSAGMTLEVTVENRTGHKLPSGYSEGRIMWLEVVVRAGDRVLWSSGLAKPGEVPEDASDLRTYRAVAEDADDGTRLHLLRNNRWVEDTRIPPKGLRADPETDPVGDRYTPLPDGTWPNVDRVKYAFSPRTDVKDETPDVKDEADVSVRLLYLINTPEYVEFLAAENARNDAGTTVKALFDERGGAPPVVLASFAVKRPLIGFAAPGEGTGTTDAAATRGATEGGSGEGPSATGDATKGTEGAGTDAASAGGSPTGPGCGCGTNGSLPTGTAAFGLAFLAIATSGRRARHGRRSAHHCRRA